MPCLEYLMSYKANMWVIRCEQLREQEEVLLGLKKRKINGRATNLEGVIGAFNKSPPSTLSSTPWDNWRFIGSEKRKFFMVNSLEYWHWPATLTSALTSFSSLLLALVRAEFLFRLLWAISFVFLFSQRRLRNFIKNTSFFNCTLAYFH